MDQTAEAPPNTGTAVKILSAPRLPYSKAINEQFGVDAAAWRALTEAIYPAAKTTDAVVMALSYCRARKLDPFKKPVHIVPMWSSAKGGYVETVWPGISELRTTAFRTGQYAGCDETEFGEMKQETFKGRVKSKEGWQEKTVAVEFPEWARITVYRDLNGSKCKFVGPKVKWLEAYATIGNSDLPNDMWQERSVGQLEKCAEAAALRKAFPEELGNMLSAEEMEGRSVDAVPAEVRAPTNGAKPTLEGALDNLATNGTKSPATQPETIEGEAIEEPQHEGQPSNETAVPVGKSELLAEVEGFQSKLSALQWQRDRSADIAGLSKADRSAVDKAFIDKQASLPN